MDGRLKRRDFLKSLALAGATLSSLGRVFGGTRLAQAATVAHPIQLHLHGHWAHSFPATAETPGLLPSMQWHSRMAVQQGIPNIWWSDHAHSFHQYQPFQKVYEPPLLIGNGGMTDFLEMPVCFPGGFPEMAGRVWPPIHARPKIVLTYTGGPFDTSHHIRVELDLSWHFGGDLLDTPVRHKLTFILNNADGMPTTVGDGQLQMDVLCPEAVDEHGILTLRSWTRRSFPSPRITL